MEIMGAIGIYQFRETLSHLSIKISNCIKCFLLFGWGVCCVFCCCNYFHLPWHATKRNISFN